MTLALIILGDFNTNILSNTIPDVFTLRDLLNENSLVLVPFGPTNHTHTSHTELDLCIVDSCDTVSNRWKTDSPFISGHDLIDVTLDIPVPEPQKKNFTFKDFKSVDNDTLCDFLGGCDWTIFNGDITMKQGLDCLYEHLNLAVEACVPVKTVQQGVRGRHPWFNREHRNLISERDRLYRRYRRTRWFPDLLDYRSARDIAHKNIESARLSF